MYVPRLDVTIRSPLPMNIAVSVAELDGAMRDVRDNHLRRTKSLRCLGNCAGFYPTTKPKSQSPLQEFGWLPRHHPFERSFPNSLICPPPSTERHPMTFLYMQCAARTSEALYQFINNMLLNEAMSSGLPQVFRRNVRLPSRGSALWSSPSHPNIHKPASSRTESLYVAIRR